MLNWIVWNRTDLTFNCKQTNIILILKWIVWNGTVYSYKRMDVVLNNLQGLKCHKTQANKQLGFYTGLLKEIWGILNGAVVKEFDCDTLERGNGNEVIGKKKRQTSGHRKIPLTLSLLIHPRLWTNIKNRETRSDIFELMKEDELTNCSTPQWGVSVSLAPKFKSFLVIFRILTAGLLKNL